MPYVIALIGIGLVMSGMLTELRSETIMQQIYGSIYILGGLVVGSIGYVAHAINRVKAHVKGLKAEQIAAAAPPAPAKSFTPLPILNSGYPGKEGVICGNCGRSNAPKSEICECGMGLGRLR